MEMFVEAVRLILREGRTVTLQSFCAHTGYKPNHHTKRFLERMVKEDFVTAFSVKFGDGYTRRVYCAQNTRSMFERSYQSSELDHSRLMPTKRVSI
jgi:hypothetical protein